MIKTLIKCYILLEEKAMSATLSVFLRPKEGWMEWPLLTLFDNF